METEKKKITEIRLNIKQARYEKNEAGERIKVEKDAIIFKEVKCVSGWTRFGHFIIDRICFFLFEFILFFVIGFIGNLVGFGVEWMTDDSNKWGITLLEWVILQPLFYFLWEYFFQKTPGKWITQCSVVDEYGDRPAAGQIIGRSFARSIPFEAFSCLSERGWHDTMSDTFLIKDEHLRELKAIMMIDEIGKPYDNTPPENLTPNTDF